MSARMSAISRNLEALMKERGLSRNELAKRAGINVHAVHNILQGKVKEPPATKLQAIADVLGVDIQQLLHGKSTDKAAQPQTNQAWDGVLYADSVVMVREICRKKGLLSNFSENEAKARIMQMADKVYRYCTKKGLDGVDATFAEFVVEEEI